MGKTQTMKRRDFEPAKVGKCQSCNPEGGGEGGGKKGTQKIVEEETASWQKTRQREETVGGGTEREVL